MKLKFHSRQHLGLIVLVFAAVGLSPFGSQTANATDYTWDGDGSAPFNWSDNTNWVGNTAPGYGTLVFTGTLGTTNTIDANYSMNQINWNGSSAWILNNSGGSVLSLFDNGGTTQAKIESLGTGGVTINAPITFAATAGPAWGEINAVSSSITFGTGTLTVNGSAVAGIRMFGGSGGISTTFNNTVSASGKYFATSSVGQTVNIGGSFTSGDFYLMNSGSLNVNSGATLNASAVRLGGDFATTGTQDLTKGATFNLADTAGGQTYSGTINSVASNTSGALVVNSQNTSNTNTLSGHLALDSNLAITQATSGTLAINQGRSTASGTTTATDIKNFTLTFNATGTGAINVGPASATGFGTIYDSVSGSGGTGIIKNGTGSLSFNDPNSYRGKTQINAGTLFVGANSALGSSNGTVGTTGNTVLLGDTTGSSNANLLTTGAFTIANAISLQTGNSGVMTLGGNTAAATIYTGAVSLGTIGSAVVAKDGTFVALSSGSADFQGVIQEGTSNTTNANVTIGDSTHSGTVKFSNAANSYTGSTTIGNGATLEVAALAAGAANSSIGNSAGTAANLVLDNGTLRYTGTTAQGTSRFFTIGAGGATFDASSSNNSALTFTGAGAGSIVMSGGTTRTLTLTGSSTGANAMSNIIVDGSGATSVTKSGAGTWALSGANTYTGTTTISNGTLSVGANNNLGSVTVGQAAVSLNGGTLKTTAGITNTHAITVGASGGTINNAANANLVFGTANTLLGSGTLTIIGNGAYSLATTARAGVVPINASNTYNGNVILQDGGLLEYGNASALASSATVTVNNNGTLSAQGVAVANDAAVNTGGVLAFQNVGTGSFTGNITLTGATTVRLQNWWSSAVQNGLISGKMTGTGSVTINSGTGSGAVLTLTNATSDYTGASTISGAVVNVGNLANVNTASSIGKGSVGGSSADLILSNGTLRYTGATAQSTDRLFSVGTNGGTLDASGSDNANPLSFTGTGAMGFNSQTGTRTLTLTGTNTGTNSLALAIGDNSGATSITKTGAGTWALGGTNSYSGATTVSVGTLSFLNTAAKSASTTVTAAAGTAIGLGVGGAGFYGVADVNSLIANTLTGFSMNATTVAGIDTTAGDFTFDTTGQSGTRGLAKIGANKLILSGTNTYSGAFQIQTGTLEYQSATAMSSNSALTIGNGGTLSLRADANTTFTPASVIGSVGNYTIEVNQLTGAGAGKTLTLANTFNTGASGSNLTVSSTSGDTLLLSSQLAQFNASSPSATINLSGANMTLDAGVNYNGATNGPLLNVNAGSNTMVINGNWTTGGNRWSGIQINTGTVTMANGQNGGSSTNNGVYAILNGGTLNLNNANAIGGANAGNNFTINGGTLDNTSGSTKTLSKNPATTINGDFAFSTSGGTSANDLNLGTNTVSLGSAAGTSRTITANGAATLTLGGVISNGTTANSIIKAGTGTLALTNTGSTFSGGLRINAGTVIQGGAATGAQGSGTITLGDGTTSAVATLSGAGSAAITNTNAITIASGGSGTYTIAATTNSDYNFSGAVALNNVATFKVTSGGQLGFSNSITGSSQITIDGAGTTTKNVLLSGNNSSTFTGNVLIQNGLANTGLKLGASNALSTANTVTVDSTSGIDLGGFNLSVAGLNDVVTGAGGSKITGTGDIALGGSGTYSFSGVINGTGTKNLTKSGTGTQTLSGTNTYAGATAVQLGKLVVSGFIGNSAVTVTGLNTTLASGTTGTIGSSVTINNGAILAAGNTNAIGTATVGSGGTTMNSGSIFSWDLDTTAANTAGTGYDNVVTSGLGGASAVFAVVLKSGQSFTDTFWNSSHSWDNVFSTNGLTATALGMTSIFSSFTYNGSGSAPVSGAFTFTGTGGNTLTWSAVPEPTSALAGLLIGAGLLGRRRRI